MGSESSEIESERGENELQPVISIYRWMEDAISNFLKFFSNFLEFKRSQNG